jgi:hypothetical protein
MQLAPQHCALRSRRGISLFLTKVKAVPPGCRYLAARLNHYFGVRGNGCAIADREIRAEDLTLPAGNSLSSCWRPTGAGWRLRRCPTEVWSWRATAAAATLCWRPSCRAALPAAVCMRFRRPAPTMRQLSSSRARISSDSALKYSLSGLRIQSTLPFKGRAGWGWGKRQPVSRAARLFCGAPRGAAACGPGRPRAAARRARDGR